mgnify:CR=1 FL=1
MKAYMVQSAKQIEPFGDHPRDCLIANRRLADIQEEALRNLGLRLAIVPDGSLVHDPDEHIIFVDTLCVTTELLSEFIERSRRLRSRTTCALKPGVTTLRSVVATQDVQTHPEGIEYGLHSVLYPHANVGARFVSLALWGRDSLAGDGVTLADFRLDGESVRVFNDGSEADTQNTFIGTCLGHRVYLGAGCVLAPGRMVPNDWRLAPERTRVISTCRPDGNVPGYRLIDGSRPGLPFEEVDTEGREDYSFHTQAAIRQ